MPSDFLVNSNGRVEDVTKRPEIRNATVEFIAPGDYMVRHYVFHVADLNQQSELHLRA